MNTETGNSFVHPLHDSQDIVSEDYGNWAPWTFKSFYCDRCMPDYFFLPNRREFYQMILITSGIGILIIGSNTYHIKTPVMLFVHPNEIISWKSVSMESGTHYALFKKAFVIRHPQFKTMLDKFGLFRDKRKSVIHLNNSEVHTCCQYFEKIEMEEQLNSIYREDTIQALLQLLIVESMKSTRFIAPREVAEYSHISRFFDLLEKEISGINFTNPIQTRTAKEFANKLHIHPNYLNVLLKKQTGQNVSTHIRNRILEEAKTMLLHTDWNLQSIAYIIGFSEQSNFNSFFKKETGFTPAGFRRDFN